MVADFEFIPAIDVLGGRCVQLAQGKYDRATVFDDDPVAVAAAVYRASDPASTRRRSRRCEGWPPVQLQSDSANRRAGEPGTRRTRRWLAHAWSDRRGAQQRRRARDSRNDRAARSRSGRRGMSVNFPVRLRSGSTRRPAVSRWKAGSMRARPLRSNSRGVSKTQASPRSSTPTSRAMECSLART